MPHFAPVRVRGGLPLPGGLVRHRRRAMALGLAVTAAALVAAGPRDADRSRGRPDGSPAARAASVSSGDRAVRARGAGAAVTAAVRIADAATVRLLRPGDRVDVIAAEETASGGEARVVARGARVTEVPEPADGADGAGGTGDGGALVVLSVPRSTAAELAGASATARLAVTVW
ncbi:MULTISPECIES: RcpC/CpaB family pilus assembly protein [unclassified Streptomyces]|uniref:RcpC/CpaB family pilus assembly protein n=1 Tax=unclassified Streptomyces TaxID=2593676 RepID=UPI000964B421|nr:RcpC/CpaB family pilus assembly protein [Streptomyces sp. CB02400]OKJ99197.1 hypothetical protein AMK33_28705 [Streptomyces sp. CB02400]